MDKCLLNLTVEKTHLNVIAMEETTKPRTQLSFIKSHGMQYTGKIQIKRRPSGKNSCYICVISLTYKKFSYINKKKTNKQMKAQ